MDSDLMDRPSPRVIEGLEEFARILHPEAFKSGAPHPLPLPIGERGRGEGDQWPRHENHHIQKSFYHSNLSQPPPHPGYLCSIHIRKRKRSAVSFDPYSLPVHSGSEGSRERHGADDHSFPQTSTRYSGRSRGSRSFCLGATFQALLRNPLADPYILGVSSGAAVGAIVAILWGSVHVIWSSFGFFLGALLTILVVFYFGRQDRKIHPHTLLLAGVITGPLSQPSSCFSSLSPGEKNSIRSSSG